MPSLHEFLGAQHQTDGWRFHIPSELHGAFGGAFGGVVASCALVASRSAAPGRIPNALDCRFLRGLPAGGATATTAVLNAGRTLTNVAVDLTGEDGRLCCRATISLVDREVLQEFEQQAAEPGDWVAHADAPAWPPVAPIVETLDPRMVGQSDGWFATAVVVPWEDEGRHPDHGAEAVCMAGDMAVGPPLGAGAPRGVRTPNPDLSLRFCGRVDGPVIVGAGKMQRAAGGVAAIDIQVWSGQTLVGTGISTALLLPP